MVMSVVGAVPAAAHHGSNGTICIVNDIGGPDTPFSVSDRDMRRAEARFRVDVEIADSATEAEIAANIDQFVTSGECDLIVGMGFIVAFALEPFAAGNPAQLFASIDGVLSQRYPNVAEVVFEVDEPSFLAGYVAAAVSETGKVGVFGGLPIPPVTDFMDGYALGVEKYNAAYGADVEVLGWDVDTRDGLFTFDFGNPALGQGLASDLYDMGADTVFPVAGFTSFGALDEAKLRKGAGDDVRVIGVDYDWSKQLGDPDRVILTSVVKDGRRAVYNQIKALVRGTWTDGFVYEGLGGAAYMAPFRKLRRVVPGFIRRDLPCLRRGIINGTIPTMP